MRIESQTSINAIGTNLHKDELEQQKKQQIIHQLRQTDQKVRQHEQAHLSAGGGIALGGPRYHYIKGPDGKLYAIGGEVPIDTTIDSDPQKTIQKMRKVIAAALAPSDPSPQDYRVAAKAKQIIMRMQKLLDRQEPGSIINTYA